MRATTSTGLTSNTVFRVTAATDMDAGSLAGWSFGGNIKFDLKGRVVPSGPATVAVEAELVSNLDNHAVGHFFAQAGSTPAQSFTTGSSSRSYGLTAVRFHASAGATQTSLVVSIHEDNSGEPAATALFTLTGPAVSGFGRREYTYSAPANALLDPDRPYWVVFSNSSSQITLFETQDLSEQGIAAGWSIGNSITFRPSPTAVWEQNTGNDVLRMAVDGTFFHSEWAEPPGQDFPASEATPGRVRLGEYSTGTLDDASDRDWFRIDGLEHFRQYRLEVDFLGANVVGGSLDIFSSRLGRAGGAPERPVGQQLRRTRRARLLAGRGGHLDHVRAGRVGQRHEPRRRQEPLHRPLHDHAQQTATAGGAGAAHGEQPGTAGQRPSYVLQHWSPDRRRLNRARQGDGDRLHDRFACRRLHAGQARGLHQHGPPYRHGGYRHDHRRWRRRRCHCAPGLQHRRRRQDADGSRRARA